MRCLTVLRKRASSAAVIDGVASLQSAAKASSRTRADAWLSRASRRALAALRSGLVEPFGKPVEDRLEDRHRIRGTALIARQPGKAYGGAQFPGQGALPPCLTQRLPVVIFGRRRGSGRALRQQKLAPDAQQLCDCPARLGSNGNGDVRHSQSRHGARERVVPDDADVLPPGLFGSMHNAFPHLLLSFSAIFLGDALRDRVRPRTPLPSNLRTADRVRLRTGRPFAQYTSAQCG